MVDCGKIVSGLVSLLVLVFVFCSTEPIVTDKYAAEIPIVLSLLCPEREGVSVYVGRSFPEIGIEPIPDAVVEISDDRRTERLRYRGAGIYVDDRFRVHHSITYRYIIHLPSGKVLTGATQIPQKLDILDLSPGDTLHYRLETCSIPYHNSEKIGKGPPIRWSGGGAVNICYFQFSETIPGQRHLPLATADSAVATLPLHYPYWPCRDAEFVPLRRARLMVCAVDSNFYLSGGSTYSETISKPMNPDDLFWGQSILTNHSHRGWSNVVNGSGVIGSYTYDYVDVYIAVREISGSGSW